MKNKDITNKEYLTLKKVSLKYNKYYASDIRLYTKTKILETIRLNLKIRYYDRLLDQWETLISE